MRRRTLLVAGAKTAVSLGLLALILAGVDVAALAARLDADVAAAGAVALVLLQGQAVGAAVRWRLVLRVHGQTLPFGRNWRNVMLGLFGNQAMPSTIGGDALRVWNAWRLGLPLGLAARSLVVDRVFSFMGLIALCAAALPILVARADDPGVAHGVTVLVLGGLGCLLLLLALRALPRRVVRHRAVAAAVALSQSAWQVLGSPRCAAPVLALALLPHLIDITVVWLYALALGVPVSWPAVALVFPAAMLTAAVPVSIAGWGLREGALVLGFALLGLPAGPAVACGLLYGASAVATGLIGGGVWVLGDADGLASLRRARREADRLPGPD